MGLTRSGVAIIFNLMVKYRTEGLNEVFGALADPTRRAILARLALGETSVGDLAAPFEMSLPAVSKHLKVLEAAGLLKRTRAGRVHHCRLNAAAMRDAAGWIDQYRRFWEDRFESLARYLEESHPHHPHSKPDAGDDDDA